MKVEEEAKSKEMEDLYLPPRSRKTLQQPSGPGEGEIVTSIVTIFVVSLKKKKKLKGKSHVY